MTARQPSVRHCAFDFEGDPSLRTNHFEVFDELSDSAEFLYSSTPGYWMFSGMEAVHEALTSPGLFSNAPLSAMKRDREKRVPYRFVPQQLDPPEHGLYRRIIMPLLSPVRMRKLEPGIRATAAELAAGLRSRGRCEVVEDFARPLVMSVFLELFGLPGEETRRFADLAGRLLVGDPEDVDGSGVQAVFDELTEFLAAAVDECRSRPREDVLSGIVHGRVNGEPLPESRLAEMVLQVFTAGLETTTAAIAYLIRHCAGDPVVQEEIRADRSLVPAAVEESLRLYSQVAPSRRVVQDADFRGCPVKKDDYVVLPLAFANRDLDAFSDARRFDLRRADNRHIAFGAGAHRCAGSHLARVELVAAVDEFHQALPSYRPAPDASVEEYVVGISGPVRVDIEWDVKEHG
ncbi:cytochrome P450 [Pseudonocardia xishanensis]|uniref:Cytochrome P450 n=1 Tax=Pseudonocardia xishanensis TaxID=630995 RepID=A0ABP8RZA2_9PSEU